jgi:hypothetical protein
METTNGAGGDRHPLELFSEVISAFRSWLKPVKGDAEV